MHVMRVTFSFTCLTCNYMHSTRLHAFCCFFYPFVGPSVTSLFHAANMFNTHEEQRSRQTTWIVRGFCPILTQKSPSIRRMGETLQVLCLFRPQGSDHALFHPCPDNVQCCSDAGETHDAVLWSFINLMKLQNVELRGKAHQYHSEEAKRNARACHVP